MLSGVAPQNCKTYASRCSKLWDSVDSADMYFPAHKQTPKNMIPFNESHIWISPKNDDVILSVSPSIPFPPRKKIFQLCQNGCQMHGGGSIKGGLDLATLPSSQLR